MKKLEQVLQDWEAVIGLEIHTELTTLTTKMFCGCKLEFGAAPNTHTCPVCLGLPGALPVPNKAAIESIVLAGLATNCDIEKHSMFYRKNYMYPDMAKNFQTTQGPVAFCMRGHLDLDVDGPAAKERTDIAGLGAGDSYENVTVTDTGYTAHVGITRIHMEEDAGKLVHDMSPTGSHFDANRCGTPLCEIVTEPDIRSPEEAVLTFKKIKQILEYTGVSHANMENGNIRCDGNISIRPSEDAPFGTRAEIKNLNSFTNLEKALTAEMLLQTVTLDAGKEVLQCTKRYDPNADKTSVIRSKEDAPDYKYFPEPDMVRLVTDPAFVEEIRRTLPELPDARFARFIKDYKLTEYDAQVLTDEIQVSNWFDSAAKTCKNPKILANWVITELLREVKELEGGFEAIKVKPEHLSRLVNLIEDGTINGKIAKQVFADMFETGKDPDAIVKEKGLVQITDTGAIEKVVREVIAKNAPQFAEFKGGKVALKGFFVGQVMKNSGGKANPKIVNQLLDQIAKE